MVLKILAGDLSNLASNCGHAAGELSPINVSTMSYAAAASMRGGSAANALPSATNAIDNRIRSLAAAIEDMEAAAAQVQSDHDGTDSQGGGNMSSMQGNIDVSKGIY